MDNEVWSLVIAIKEYFNFHTFKWLNIFNKKASF